LGGRGESCVLLFRRLSRERRERGLKRKEGRGKERKIVPQISFHILSRRRQPREKREEKGQKEKKGRGDPCPSHYYMSLLSLS